MRDRACGGVDVDVEPSPPPTLDTATTSDGAARDVDGTWRNSVSGLAAVATPDDGGLARQTASSSAVAVVCSPGTERSTSGVERGPSSATSGKD